MNTTSPLAQALDAVRADDFDEADAHVLLDAIVGRYQWAFALWTHSDVLSALHANEPGESGRDLTGAEWQRLTGTREWSQRLHEIAYDAVINAQGVPEAIAAAGLECFNCDTDLHDAPAATGGLCDTCRTGPAGQPVAVDPVTTGLYWLDAATGALMYVGPVQDSADSWPAPYDWDNVDELAAARARTARQHLATKPAPHPGDATASPWHRDSRVLIP
jgi:hypothetical protein